MAANANDLLIKTGEGTATTLSSPGYTIGNTSVTVVSTTNWPTDTGVIFAIDTAEIVDGEQVQIAGTYCKFEGVVSGATSITSVDLVTGTPQNYAAGALTRVYIPLSSEVQNRMVDHNLAEHAQDGTHTAITATSLVASAQVQAGTSVITDTIAEKTAAAGVTIDGMQVKDSLVVGGAGAGIANSSLSTGVGEPGGAWNSWTPTWTNVTIGNATVTAVYKQIGKAVFFRINMLFGSTTSITGGIIFSLPVTAAVHTGNVLPIGIGTITDAGVAGYAASILFGSTTTGVLRVDNAAGTYVSRISTAATVPMTWVTGDEFSAIGVYEAA